MIDTRIAISFRLPVSPPALFDVVAIDPRWASLLDEAWISALDRTTFLSRCREGSISRRELTDFVRQQFFYARHFTQYLCALLSNLDSEADRKDLAQNLFEEMGLGALGSIPHSEIYRRMMTAMGIDPDSDPMRATTRGLIEAMLANCRDADPMVGLGALCLGAEAIVPHVYSQIVAGFRAIGEKDENLEFFHLHIAGDDDHAITMRRIIERELELRPAAVLPLKEAAARVIAARVRFFEGVTHEIV